MKGLKYFAITGILTLSAFAAVTYSSCTKDACNGVTCLNKGTCSGGICTCKDGFGGVNCEVEYRKVFTGTYQGFVHNPGHNDTAIFRIETTGDTTNFKSMNVTWLESKMAPVTFAVELNSPTSEGATFAIPKTTVGGNKTYIGNGAITGKTATINLSETIVTPTDTTHSSLSFPNLIKAN